MSSFLDYSTAGLTANNPLPVSSTRNPTTSDVIAPDGAPYNVGRTWVNTSTSAVFSYAGHGVWVALATSASGPVDTLTGDTGTATPVAGNIKIAGTTNQITTAASGSTVTVSLPSAITTPGSLTTTTSLTATTTVTAGTGITSTTGNIVATAGAVSAGTTVTGGTGVVATTGNVSATAGAVNAGTSMTATLGDITATNGNFVSSASGKGLLFNSPTATGAAASPVVVNGRSGQAIFTSVSIAAAADLTLTITNSAITGSATQIIYSMSGATTGSALSIKSVTNTAGSSAIVVTNGTLATTTTADITLNFIVVN